MKKIYQAPRMQVTTIEIHQIIAASSLDINRSGDGDGTVLVKRDRSSRGSYNVWDEDWSN